MNIVEKEAIRFVYNYHGDEIEMVKDKLSTKLYNFTRDEDKISFLNILRNEVEKEKLEHEKTCTTEGCSITEEKELGLFVIDQEIEDISNYYSFVPKDQDKFEAIEISNLHVKLNEVINKIKELGVGQEIIFNEIDDLKNNFNLGKKNWFQLLKGKLFDLTASEVLEKTVVKEVYRVLSEGYENLPNLIN